MARLTFEGGINEQDVTLVDPRECVSGYNFELGSPDSRFRPRLPFDIVDTATNASQVQGFVQLIKADDTITTLVQAGTDVYEWDGSTFTDRGDVTASSSKLRGVTWTLGGYSVITDLDKSTVVKQWDGTNFTTLTTGLGGTDLYAKYGVVHLNRVWLFNVKAGTDTPHLLVASAFEDPTSYDITLAAQDTSFSTGNEAFYMTTPDLRPINGVALFFNTLIISTEGGHLWKLTGSDSMDFAWEAFYPNSNATGTETIASIGNDVVYLKTGGVVESLRATDQFGDVRGDDLSRWMRTTTAGLTDCITVYDQENQKVYFFAGTNKVLVLFKDMLDSGLSPWSLYKTDHTSGFSTNAAAYLRDPSGNTSDWRVYWGDSVGNIFRMEGTGAGDNGDTTIVTHRRSKFFDDIEGLDTRYQRVRGRVYYRRVSDVDLLMDFEWGEDYAINRCTVPLKGPPLGESVNYWGGSAYWGGTFYWNEGFQFSQRVSTQGFSPIGRGPGFHVDLEIDSDQTFDVMRIEV